MEQGIRIPGVSRQELKRIKAMSLFRFLQTSDSERNDGNP